MSFITHNQIRAVSRFFNLVSDGYGITKPVSDREEKLKVGVRILPTRALTFEVKFVKQHIGQFRVPILATIKSADHSQGPQAGLKHMIVEVVFKVRFN